MGGDALSKWHPNEKRDADNCWLGWLGKDRSDLGIWSFDQRSGGVYFGTGTASALSFPPEQFVRDYYSKINNRQVPAAWNLLSPRFQRNKKLMQKGYSEYLEWWGKKVEQVKINQVILVTKNTNSAIVEIKLQYFMRETQRLSSPESIRLFLVWDSKNSRWLIDEGKRLS